MTMMVFVACGDDDVLPIGDGSSSSGVSSAGVVSSASLASQGSSGFSASSAASSLPVYTVNFDSQGGSSVEAQTIPSGGKVNQPASPAWGVSIFRGWYRDAGATLPWNFSVDTVTNALTLYAGWTIRYEVRFDSCGGSPVAVQRIAPGGKVALPMTPEWVMAEFRGWYKEATLQTLWDFSVDTVSNSITLYAKWQDSIYLEMVSVNGGIFWQDFLNGDPFMHSISSYKIGKYEITYKIWYKVSQWAKTNGYYFANEGWQGSDGGAYSGLTSQQNEPVTSINWRDAMVWCNAYSEIERLVPVYYTDKNFLNPIKDSRFGSASVNTNLGSYDNPYVKWSADGFRLPTVGEWQYAARYKDGTSWTPYNYASGSTDIDDIATGLVAWYSGNSDGSTETVGLKNANAMGIHDMSGNVSEWCWDWSGVNPTSMQTNYHGSQTGNYRLLMGGAFDSEKWRLYVGGGVGSSPAQSYTSYGFRVARSQ